jgi:phosphatidylserine/phosphatidylglycerophosphate/cardiolipin synthase-like enzyme
VKRGLSEVSTALLERLRDAVEEGQLRAPLSRDRLSAFGVRLSLDDLVACLEGHGKVACLAILEAVLAEREKLVRPAPELVWTGPEGQNAAARDTAVVLQALFESAHERVVLAGYSFDQAHAVLTPLHTVMRDRGVVAHFFVNVEQPREQQAVPEAWGRAALEAFLARNWPFGDPRPHVYCDRRALQPGLGAEYCSLHAKCVSVDGERAFVSSANFTARGHDRNIEAGVLLHDPAFARQLDRQWMSLIEGGFVLEGRR